MPEYTGALRKMHVQLPEQPDASVQYSLALDSEAVPLNEALGQPISLSYAGQINCVHCNRKTKKSFSQGYCYPCFRKLARCDQCIVSPEKCHYHLGTCREPVWGEEFCMQDHYVYLANSSGLKVGITRGTQIPTRWIDQGAVQAIPIYRVQTRRQAGLVEMALKAHVADKTNWRAMLKGSIDLVDMQRCAAEMCGLVEAVVGLMQQEFGLQAIMRLADAKDVKINYPVQHYPEKIISHNFDKEPLVTGVLNGIKGQYLLLDSGVINLRKFGGYHITVVVG